MKHIKNTLQLSTAKDNFYWAKKFVKYRELGVTSKIENPITCLSTQIVHHKHLNLKPHTKKWGGLIETCLSTPSRVNPNQQKIVIFMSQKLLL